MIHPDAVPEHSAGAASAIRVLIAEDEAHLGAILEQFLSTRGFIVRVVRDGGDALELLRREVFDVALLDVVMPALDGLEVLRLVREEPMPPEVIVMTGNGGIETSISAISLGAYDVLSKPYRMAEIEGLVRRAWEKRVLRRNNLMMQSRLRRMEADSAFITQYAPLRAVLSALGRVAPGVSSVLVAGEPGTGKRLIARMLHTQGGAAGAPFIERRCADLNGTQAAIELFGVERGSGVAPEQYLFGALELAAGGTLFLDDISMLGSDAQSLLLQCLEDGFFRKSGGTHRIGVDARLIVSASGDPGSMVRRGTFSGPLLQRLSTVSIVLPPLRDRRVDIPLLASHYLQQYAHPAPVLTDEAVAALERYDWPGNVRELRSLMEHAALLARDGSITTAELSFGLGRGSDAGIPALHGTRTMSLAELERAHIADVLSQCDWHQGRAAVVLGISPKTLYRKIREYGFRRPAGRGETA